MITLSDLCRDIFFLAQIDIDGSGPVRGRLWEQRVADHLARHGVPSEPLPGGYSIFGHVSLSTLKHQIDGTLECTDAIVIGEWKAFRDKLPKNELLRFKAATDDYFMALGNEAPSRPVVRIFAGSAKQQTRFGPTHICMGSCSLSEGDGLCQCSSQTRPLALCPIT